MRTIDDLSGRIRAALLGAAAGEGTADAPAGVRQLLELCEHLAAQGGVLDPAALGQAEWDDMPAGGPAGLLLRAVPLGLLSPLDRPRLRLASHRAATVTGADEGTAMTAVAVAVLAADLCRFDLETALVRLRQTLLEEAPTALHSRLRVLGWSEPADGSGDPGSTLQLALTALFRSDDVPGAIGQAAGFDGEVAVVCALAGALAGARGGMAALEGASLDHVPARDRVEAVAARLGAVASAQPAAQWGLRAGALEAIARLGDGRSKPPA